jgi:hypothetical protein
MSRQVIYCESFHEMAEQIQMLAEEMRDMAFGYDKQSKPIASISMDYTLKTITVERLA